MNALENDENIGKVMIENIEFHLILIALLCVEIFFH